MRKPKSKTGRLKLLVNEITLNNEKCYCCSMNKQPIVKKGSVVTVLESLIENVVNFIIYGDLNISMLAKNFIADMLDVYIYKEIGRSVTKVISTTWINNKQIREHKVIKVLAICQKLKILWHFDILTWESMGKS